MFYGDYTFLFWLLCGFEPPSISRDFNKIAHQSRKKRGEAPGTNQEPQSQTEVSINTLPTGLQEKHKGGGGFKEKSGKSMRGRNGCCGDCITQERMNSRFGHCSSWHGAVSQKFSFSFAGGFPSSGS